MPCQCMNSRASAMSLAHRVKPLAAPDVKDMQTRCNVLILENASHQVFLAEFHHESYSQPIFFSNQCSTIKLYSEVKIHELPLDKCLRNNITLFSSVNSCHAMISFCCYIFTFCFIVPILLSKHVNYRQK